MKQIETGEAEQFGIISSGSDFSAMPRLGPKASGLGSTNSRILMTTEDPEVAVLAIAAGAAAVRRASRTLSV